PSTAVAPRCRRRVALVEHDVVQLAAELVRNQLRDRRLEAVPRAAGAHVDVHDAARLDADRGLVGAQRAGTDASGLDKDGHADADVAPFGPRALLLLPELVPAEQLGRLLDRLGRTDEVEQDAAGARVGLVLAPDHVAAPQLDRIHADLP